jgi:hypothetical protein
MDLLEVYSDFKIERIIMFDEGLFYKMMKLRDSSDTVDERLDLGVWDSVGVLPEEEMFGIYLLWAGHDEKKFISRSENEQEAVEAARKLASVLDINFKGLVESKLQEQDEDTPEEVEVKEEPVEKPEEEPEVKEEPEEPEEPEAPEITKEYVGNTEDMNYYLISNEDDEGNIEDLKIVDQEGVDKFSAVANSIPVENAAEFLLKAIMELKIQNIEFGIFEKYLYPYVFEEEKEEEEPEETEELEDQGLEAMEEPEKPVESKKVEEVLGESKKNLLEMKLTDYNGNVFDVYLSDDGTSDTVIDVGGKEFRFDPEFTSYWRDEEGNLSEEGLKELALDVLSSMEPENYQELVSRNTESSEEVPEEENEPTIPLKKKGTEYESKTEEGYDNPGVRDGTGPHKDSMQRKEKGNVGKRKERGEDCPCSEDKVDEDEKDFEWVFSKDKTRDKQSHVLLSDVPHARQAITLGYRQKQAGKVPDWYDGSLEDFLDDLKSAISRKYPDLSISKLEETKIETKEEKLTKTFLEMLE